MKNPRIVKTKKTKFRSWFDRYRPGREKCPYLMSLLTDAHQNRYEKIVRYLKGTPIQMYAEHAAELDAQYGHMIHRDIPEEVLEYKNKCDGQISFYAYNGFAHKG